MKTHETSTKDAISSGLFGEIMGPLAAAVHWCHPTDLQHWVGRKGELIEGAVAFLTRTQVIPSESIKEIQSWFDLYREEFGIVLNFARLGIPEFRPNTWLVVADERVTNNQVYEVCVKKFPCSRDIDDLNVIFDLHVKGTTARRFQATVEADHGRRSQSADDIEREGLTPKAIIPKERMLLELWYFRETGEHLDINNWTICAGSRYQGGRVPRVGWSGDGMVVGLDLRVSRYGSGRARVAVS